MSILTSRVEQFDDLWVDGSVNPSMSPKGVEHAVSAASSTERPCESINVAERRWVLPPIKCYYAVFEC